MGGCDPHKSASASVLCRGATGCFEAEAKEAAGGILGEEENLIAADGHTFVGKRYVAAGAADRNAADEAEGWVFEPVDGARVVGEVAGCDQAAVDKLHVLVCIGRGICDL